MRSSFSNLLTAFLRLSLATASECQFKDGGYVEPCALGAEARNLSFGVRSNLELCQKQVVCVLGYWEQMFSD